MSAWTWAATLVSELVLILFFYVTCESSILHTNLRFLGHGMHYTAITSDSVPIIAMVLTYIQQLVVKLKLNAPYAYTWFEIVSSTSQK